MFYDLVTYDINVVLVLLCCERSYCGCLAVLSGGVIGMEIVNGRHYMTCGWLKCRVDKGMFSDELAVTYPAEGEQRASVFVEKKYVRMTTENRGEVFVDVSGYAGHLIGSLPSCDRDWVWIRDEDFRIDEEWDRESQGRDWLEDLVRGGEVSDGAVISRTVGPKAEGQAYPAAEGQQGPKAEGQQGV